MAQRKRFTTWATRQKLTTSCSRTLRQRKQRRGVKRNVRSRISRLEPTLRKMTAEEMDMWTVYVMVMMIHCLLCRQRRKKKMPHWVKRREVIWLLRILAPLSRKVTSLDGWNKYKTESVNTESRLLQLKVNCEKYLGIFLDKVWHWAPCIPE